MCHLCHCPEEDNERLYRPMGSGWVLLYALGVFSLILGCCLLGVQ